MTKHYLIPIEVFGATCDHPELHGGDQLAEHDVPFGLCDSIGSQSDCNRAEKLMYRLVAATEEPWWDESTPGLLVVEL